MFWEGLPPAEEGRRMIIEYDGEEERRKLLVEIERRSYIRNVPEYTQDYMRDISECGIR